MEVEMDRAYSKNGQKMHLHRILVGKPEGRRPYEDKDIGGWIILKWISEMGWGGMDWIDLAQDRYQWMAPVNTI
jgi:hypothetical protein